MDDISFFYVAPPQSGLTREMHFGRKQVKIRLNLAFLIDASRSDCLEVLFIRKAKAPHCFQGRISIQLNLKYYNNAKAWMICDIFCSWISE